MAMRHDVLVLVLAGVALVTPLVSLGIVCDCLTPTPLWNACRSVAQAREHEGNRDVTGTEVSEGAQERAMPAPQPHQAT